MENINLSKLRGGQLVTEEDDVLIILNVDEDVSLEVQSVLPKSHSPNFSNWSSETNSLRNSFMATEEETWSQGPSVFINYRGEELRYGFFYELEQALKRKGVNVHEDDQGLIRGKSLEYLFSVIGESRIALVIFSSRYTESIWCLLELLMIKKLVEEGKLVVIPVFYKLMVSEVKELKGKFGDNFWDLAKRTCGDIIKCKEALDFVSQKMGFVFNEKSDTDADFVNGIVRVVERVITWNSGTQREKLHDYWLSEQQEDASIGSYRSEDLKGVDGKRNLLKEAEIVQSEANSRIDIGLKSTLLQIEQRIMENVLKVLGYIPADRTEDSRDKYTQVPTCIYGAKPEGSSSYSNTNDDFLDSCTINSPMDSKVKPPKIQVFINFRGELRNNFIGYLVDALLRSGINVFTDTQADRGDGLNNLFKWIEDSGIAIVVFSSCYTESKWCLDELVKIKERADHGLLKVLPIFYKVTPTNVKRLKGAFGDHFRDKEYMYASDQPQIKRWKEAIASVSDTFGMAYDEKSSTLEIDFVKTIVKVVLRLLGDTSTVDSGQSSY